MLGMHVEVGVGHSIALLPLILVGFCVGVIAGMFGTGGGFLLTPALMYLFGVPPSMAVGTALCQTCGTSIASFLKYRHLKRGEVRIDLVMMGGSLLGVHVGTELLGYLNGLGSWQSGRGHAIPIVLCVLDLLFILLLTVTAGFIFDDVRRTWRRKTLRGDVTIPGPLVTRVRIPPYIDLPNVQLKQVSAPMLAYLGFLLGLASGLMGIGGGVLFMPVLLYGFGLSARNAAGTGVLLLLVTVSLGTVEQAMKGFVNLYLALTILVGSSIGSQVGALTTHHLPNRYLRLILMLLILFVISVISYNLIRMF